MDIKDYIELAKNRMPDASGGNSKCYSFEDVVLLKGHYNKNDLDMTMDKMKKAKSLGASLCEILGYELSDEQQSFNSGFVLQQKAHGFPVHEATTSKEINKAKTEEEKIKISQNNVSRNMLEMDILNNATQEQYNNFVKDWINIKKSGLRIDPSKTSNFFYDEEKGFSFIDLSCGDEIDVTKNQKERVILISSVLSVINNDSLRYSNQMNESDGRALEDKIINLLPKLSQALQFNGISKDEINEVLYKRSPEIANKYLNEKEIFSLSLKSNVDLDTTKSAVEESPKIEQRFIDENGLEW